MNFLATSLKRLNVIETYRDLGTNKLRRETLIALASTQLLVQFYILPVALTIPSVARHFEVEVSQAAWMVIIRLLMLGSTVFLAARLGEKHGHVRIPRPVGGVAEDHLPHLDSERRGDRRPTP